jgi:pimeloyl-ACP methyl ester carboxylesterase
MRVSRMSTRIERGANQLKISSAAFFALIIATANLGQVAAAEPATPPYLTLAALRAKYADPKGHYTQVDGLEVYYKDEGSGPAILMIHGSSSTLHTYDFVAAKLIDRFRVIRFDIPDQGLSGPVTDADLARLKVDPKVGTSDIAEHLLDQLGVKSATVAGVSSGGTMALYLAAKRPDLVSRVIVSNSPSDPIETLRSSRPTAPEMIAMQKKIEADPAHFQTREFWDVDFGNLAGVPSRITPAIREQYYDFNRRPPSKNRIAFSSKVANHQFSLDQFNRVKVPVLLLWGARDPMLGVNWADVLARYLIQAQVSEVILPDVGHYPPLEVPERYAQIVAAFMEAATPPEALHQ